MYPEKNCGRKDWQVWKLNSEEHFPIRHQEKQEEPASYPKGTN